VQFLYDKGLDPNSTDKYGRKPIDDAVLNENFAIVSFLKEKTE